MVMALMFTFGACGEDNNIERDDVDVDWNDYSKSSDKAFLVANDTNKDLVAFKGSLRRENILGGIPLNSNGHGIKRSTVLLNGSVDFPMILITKEDYVKNKNDLSVLDQAPFTRIYVCYNGQGDNDIVYRISKRLGGNKIIEIGNPSLTLNVEIRLGGIYGETIGYAPAGMNMTKLYVTDGDFDLFPVFKRYNNIRDIVETLYPKGKAGAWFKPLGFDEGTDSAYFNAKEAIDALSTRTSGVAWLVINNQSTAAIHLVMGDKIARSATGVSYFNPNTNRTFIIEMPYAKVDDTDTFAASTTIANFKVGPNTREVVIKSVEDGSTELSIQADMMYVVTVTGDHNAETLAAKIEMRPEEKDGPTAVDVTTAW